MPQVSDLDDRKLLRAHVEGDPVAFDELVRRHRDRLWAVAIRTTGDREEAADAVQDALISAFRRAESFRGDAAVTTWLHRIVVNACLDRMRKRQARPTTPLPHDEDRSVLLEADAGSDDAAVSTERRADVMRALAQLPPDQRAAIVLVDMEGYSVEQAADLLSCPPGTIKSRCSRGRSKLAPLLGQYDPAGRNQAPPYSVEPPNASNPGGRAAPGQPTEPEDASQ
ncbi:MAG: RNA polymerase sigma factor SigM [Nocardioidaceae bacterium]